MRLQSEFIKLPVRFDVDRLKQEALQFTEADWDSHPLNYSGNSALHLVSVNSGQNHAFEGVMQPTEALEKCPYICQIFDSFNTVIGRSRLMRLDPNCDVPPHFDGNYSWRHRTRVHIPIITDPNIIFSSVGNKDVHMAAGEAWTFDNWRQHAVYNNSDVRRIHLVFDTIGTSGFWDLVDQGWKGEGREKDWEAPQTSLAFEPDKTQDLHYERYNSYPVRSPDEVSNMLDDLLDDLNDFQASSPEKYLTVKNLFRGFKYDWRSYWSIYWDNPDSISHYEFLGKKLLQQLSAVLKGVRFDSNTADVFEIVTHWVDSCTNASFQQTTDRYSQTNEGALTTHHAINSSNETLEEYMLNNDIPSFDRPIFIVAAPRSGSTMLFETLKSNKDIWTIDDEMHREVETISTLHPSAKDYKSGALGISDYTPQIGALLMDSIVTRLRNSKGMPFWEVPENYRQRKLRFLEKTPKNALRIPFFLEMFPDARFIFLHREPHSNIGSMIDAWQSGKFITYPELPDWSGTPWSLLLPEGWKTMDGHPQADICAWQWAQTNATIMGDLSKLPANKWTSVKYEDLLEDTATTLKELCAFCEIPYGPRMQAFATNGFPSSRYTLTVPNKDKWRRHEDQINKASSLFGDVKSKLQALGKVT